MMTMNSRRFSLALASLLCGATLLAGPATASSSKDTTTLWLTSTGLDSNATAKAVYKDKSARKAFRIEVRSLDVGPYDLSVGGVVVGTINVKQDNSGSGETKGEIRFESKKGNSMPFDPTGQSLSIDQGADTYFGADFPASPSDITNSELQVPLENAGVLLGAEGEAEYRLRNGRTDFSVEIEDVPVGDYDLRVNGTVVATIHAAPRTAGRSVQGEVEFSTDMDEVGHKPLTFEPRGALIEVLQGATPILTLSFPINPPAL